MAKHRKCWPSWQPISGKPQVRCWTFMLPIKCMLIEVCELTEDLIKPLPESFVHEGSGGRWHQESPGTHCHASASETRIKKSQQGTRCIQKISRCISGNLVKMSTWPRLMESAIMSPYSATFYHFETGKKIKATMGKVDQDCH